MAKLFALTALASTALAADFHLWEKSSSNTEPYVYAAPGNATAETCQQVMQEAIPAGVVESDPHVHYTFDSPVPQVKGVLALVKEKGNHADYTIGLSDNIEIIVGSCKFGAVNNANDGEDASKCDLYDTAVKAILECELFPGVHDNYNAKKCSTKKRKRETPPVDEGDDEPKAPEGALKWSDLHCAATIETDGTYVQSCNDRKYTQAEAEGLQWDLPAHCGASIVKDALEIRCASEDFGDDTDPVAALITLLGCPTSVETDGTTVISCRGDAIKDKDLNLPSNCDGSATDGGVIFRCKPEVEEPAKDPLAELKGKCPATTETDGTLVLACKGDAANNISTPPGCVSSGTDGDITITCKPVNEQPEDPIAELISTLGCPSTIETDGVTVISCRDEALKNTNLTLPDGCESTSTDGETKISCKPSVEPQPEAKDAIAELTTWLGCASTIETDGSTVIHCSAEEVEETFSNYERFITFPAGCVSSGINGEMIVRCKADAAQEPDYSPIPFKRDVLSPLLAYLVDPNCETDTQDRDSLRIHCRGVDHRDLVTPTGCTSTASDDEVVFNCNRTLNPEVAKLQEELVTSLDGCTMTVDSKQIARTLSCPGDKYDYQSVSIAPSCSMTISDDSSFAVTCIRAVAAPCDKTPSTTDETIPSTVPSNEATPSASIPVEEPIRTYSDQTATSGHEQPTAA